MLWFRAHVLSRQRKNDNTCATMARCASEKLSRTQKGLGSALSLGATSFKQEAKGIREEPEMQKRLYKAQKKRCSAPLQPGTKEWMNRIAPVLR